MDFHTERKILNVCGPQISRCRNELGWSQAKLAAKCQLAGWDVSRDIIARIELQIRWVGDFELATLAMVLNVPLLTLFPEPTRAKLGRIPPAAPPAKGED